MASLFSILAAGKLGIVGGASPEARNEVRNTCKRFANRENPVVKVNAQKVWDDLMGPKNEPKSVDLGNHYIPFPKPTFEGMWLEAIQDGRSVGAWVKRIRLDKAIAWNFFKEAFLYQDGFIPKDDPPFEVVVASVWTRNDEQHAMMQGCIAYGLKADGEAYWGPDKSVPSYCQNYLVTTEYLDAHPDQRPGFQEYLKGLGPWLAWQRLWIMESFGRMNCHNVKLVPMKGGGPRIKVRRSHPPFSVWHEIVVTSLPELRRQGRETAPEGEKQEIRSHRVRGHYADYTKGKGLFGKWKVRIWIEEHTAGDEEAGAVAGSYRIE